MLIAIFIFCSLIDKAISAPAADWFVTKEVEEGGIKITCLRGGPDKCALSF